MNFKKLIIVIGLNYAALSHASEQYGKVKELIVRGSDGLHYFWLEGASTNKPACSKNSYWMIKDENSAAGKAQLSIILSAQAQQKSIRVVGSGSCTRWADGEDVDYISIQ